MANNVVLSGMVDIDTFLKLKELLESPDIKMSTSAFVRFAAHLVLAMGKESIMEYSKMDDTELYNCFHCDFTIEDEPDDGELPQ